jgi:hypothetical protein
MVLVELSTQEAADHRLRTVQRLGGQVLDLVSAPPGPTSAKTRPCRIAASSPHGVASSRPG